MRPLLSIPLVLAACAYPLDDELTLVDLQVRGTHNSYHLEPESPIDPSHVYSHATLTEQLENQGVRQLELDLHLRAGGSFEVFHIPSLDEATSCRLLSECLEEVRSFSERSPDHAPILIWMEAKDLFVLDSTLEPMLPHHDRLEAVIRGVFPGEGIVTPAEVQGEHATLREAIAEDGWPSLGRLRGRVILALLDAGEHRDAYVDNAALEHLIFPRSLDASEDFAALAKVNDVRGQDELISALFDAGLVITSNIDGADNEAAENEERRSASLAAGVQFLSSDFPEEIAFDGWRCNPRSTRECEDEDIERR